MTTHEHDTYLYDDEDPNDTLEFNEYWANIEREEERVKEMLDKYTDEQLAEIFGVPL